MYAVELLSLIVYIHYQLVNKIACHLCNVLPFQVLLMITEKQTISSSILEQFSVEFLMDKTQHILKEPEVGRLLWSRKFLNQVGQVMYYSLVCYIDHYQSINKLPLLVCYYKTLR